VLDSRGALIDGSIQRRKRLPDSAMLLWQLPDGNRHQPGLGRGRYIVGVQNYNVFTLFLATAQDAIDAANGQNQYYDESCPRVEFGC